MPMWDGAILGDKLWSPKKKKTGGTPSKNIVERDPETMEGASGETPEPPSPGQQAGTPGPSHARGGTRHHRKNK